MEYTNFLEKNQKLQHQIKAVPLNIILCRTMINFLLKKSKNSRFYGTLSLSAWAILATW
jgi:hypothetical protein